jgi:mRNA-degrading endonuclease YafQ of YafQ-DinJ toxin-antitoxin module
MAYKIRTQTLFKQDTKKLKNNKPLLSEIAAAVKDIIALPLSGEKLSGSWIGFRKIGFGSKPEYRLIYAVYDCCKTDENGVKTTNDITKECDYTDGNAFDCNGFIDFVTVKKREDFNTLYKKSKKYTDLHRL